MKLKAMLICADKEKNEFDGAVRRGLAPWQAGVFTEDLAESAAISGYRSDYSLEDAISFRIWGDLTRSGLLGKDATHFVNSGLEALRGGYGFGHGDDAIEFSLPRNLFCLHEEANPIWIAREISRSDSHRQNVFLDRRDFYVRCWAGTFKEINDSICNLNEKNRDIKRETISIQFYDLSAAARTTCQIAIKLDLLENGATDTGA